MVIPSLLNKCQYHPTLEGDEKSNEEEVTNVTTVDSTAKRNAEKCTSELNNQ